MHPLQTNPLLVAFASSTLVYMNLWNLSTLISSTWTINFNTLIEEFPTMNLTRINFCGFSVLHNQTLFSWYYGLDWLNFEIIIPKKEEGIIMSVDISTLKGEKSIWVLLFFSFFNSNQTQLNPWTHFQFFFYSF